MLDRLVRLTLLYDFYGPLLTERQQQFMELYYHQDWSLAEIAQEFDVSRQAVHDLLRRAQAALEGYEAKLGLVQRFQERRQLIMELNEAFDRLDADVQRWLENDHPEAVHHVKAGIAAAGQLVRRLAAGD